MSDWWSPALWDAARRGDYAGVLRLAREKRSWSQRELGAKFGCSASAISRFENGRRSLRDVAVLRRFAEILGLPVEAFGLTATPTARPVAPAECVRASSLDGDSSEEGIDPVRRRMFLFAAGLTGTALAAPNTLVGGDDPAAFLTRRLEGVLLATSSGDGRPAPIETLQSVLASARTDFRACRYVDLAARLPELINAAEAANRHQETPESARVLAQTYNLTTRALVKLPAGGLEWVSADRALHAAECGGDPLLLAEAQRLLGSACRRAGHHDRAQALTLTAADQLRINGPDPDPQHLALYGVLMCSAGYAAARGNDRERATDLLAEADTTARRLDDHVQRTLVANVVSHRVSADYVLGNAGIALHHARSAQLSLFPDTERRARFLVDTALCFNQLNKPDRAYQALVAAERIAPGEVHTRATVRRLVGDLLRHPQRGSLAGLRQLAARTHALA